MNMLVHRVFYTAQRPILRLFDSRQQLCWRLPESIMAVVRKVVGDRQATSIKDILPLKSFFVAPME